MRIRKHLPRASGLVTALVTALALASASAATPAVGSAKPGSSVRVAQAPPLPPFKIAPPRYEDAPEPWRSYLIKAREADAIKDPLKRCLAFPTFPGSRWPEQLLPAHCEWRFGLDFSLDTVRKYLDAGDVAGLEKLFRDLQDRHFSVMEFSEHIHRAFDVFDANYESGVLSKRWLEMAPDSPFAMTARAEFYRNMGWAARGGDWAQETPDEQFQRLKELHGKAIELYRQALAKEPRMMHAHAGLVDMAKNGGALDEDKVFEAGNKIDPACKWLLDERMSALEPRWGGSYEAMGALTNSLLPYVERRPLLSMTMILPLDDMHSVLEAAEKYEDALKVLQPAVAVSSNAKVYEGIASSMAHIKGANRWEELAYLMEATRTSPGSAWIARERGRQQMLVARDAELANRSLEAAVKLEPDNLFGHYLYAASLGRLGKFDEAEREYLIAMKDKPDSTVRHDSLIELAELMGRNRRGEKASLYAKQATTEYPKDARGWISQAYALMNGESVQMVQLREVMENILAYGDPTDPRINSEIIKARAQLDKMRAAVEAQGGKW